MHNNIGRRYEDYCNNLFRRIPPPTVVVIFAVTKIYYQDNLILTSLPFKLNPIDAFICLKGFDMDKSVYLYMVLFPFKFNAIASSDLHILVTPF